MPDTAPWGPEPDATRPEPDAIDPAPSPRTELSLKDSAKTQSVVTEAVSVEKIPSPPLNLKFRIIYDPGSDQCLFVNKALKAVCLTNISRPHSTQSVTHDQQCAIQPGAWKISSETTEDRLIEFLLCKRQYTFSICQRNDTQAEQASPDRSAKRRKLSATSKKDLDSHYTKWHQMFTSFQKGHRSLNDIALPDLPDGGIATIQTPLAPNIFRNELSPSTYQLKRIRGIATTSNTLVFSCQHSIYRDVAVKVLQHKDRSLNSLHRSARLWKQEKDILLKVKHRNIGSLEAFDGRFFSLYLELLPLSLNRGLDSPFSLFEASIILKDISSALVCLQKHRIAHNDIKPNNIAFSFNRGAVLFDFGIASSLDDIQPRGTSWYAPPELGNNQRCGLAGDVWGLGITMLYVLKKVQLPEKMTQRWDIFLAAFRHTEDNKLMKQWLKIVANVRASLNRTDVIEDLVFQMLDNQASRITAAEITQTLERK
ncbi:kinase-like domain-containing protein [Trichoderma austrokoningii]